MGGDDTRGLDGAAWFAGVEARGVVEWVDVDREPERLAAGGFWAVVGDFDGPVHAWRFRQVTRGTEPDDAATTAGWRGPASSAWRSSLDREAYLRAVEAIRAEIRAGEVYQVNICRVLEAPLGGGPVGGEPDARALAAALAAGNPAPYAGGVHVPATSGLPPAWVVSASPELYLRLDGDVLTSAPIKGTATAADGLQGKDQAENVMITDLVRNDLQRVCRPGTVEVTRLLGIEQHPGLVHLVTTVQGQLTRDVAAAPDRWRRLLAATYPPGSVSGAPKTAALRLIRQHEPVRRGPYCGVVGWIDADAGRAELAVAIRTFWWTAGARTGERSGRGQGPGTLRFGTGAGITWGSDPVAEWAETELKARRLIGLASSRHEPAPH
ncbi:anthranilate synthase component I family protein [Cellulomonas fimi]|uniref:Anthranilate synthase component I family protein n=1 Tax=Cellulomonas fimi TaxID=1708 RepID=A0A7Y0LZ73_CELFI|nr:anthranilate synthase component I family protein [Cellulomonas fimi]